MILINRKYNRAVLLAQLYFNYQLTLCNL